MDGEALRDDQWDQLKPFAPGERKCRRGLRNDGRRFFDARLWMARSGAPWRDLPEDRFGPYETVKGRYYRWIEQGILTGFSKRWLPLQIWSGYRLMPR